MGKAAEIDRICDHFEEAYRNGEQPSIDEFVSNAPTDIRQQLQIELNALVADLSVEPTRPSMRIQKPDRQEYPPLECPKCHLDSLFVGSSASELRCGNPRCGHNFELQPKGEPKLAKVSYFEIVGLIGQGGFGRVWLARSEIDGIYVALKTPRIDTAPELIELFIKETRYAYQILDDGRTAGRIPQLIASGRDNGIDYLAFEFIPGNPLSMLIAQGTVTVKKAIGITLQIAETLQLAHENGLVHRDIKPGNILISKGNAYLCDFGIAKVVSGTIREAVKTEEGFTGTWAYASPEHAQPENLDARSDVFSLGIVLYELLANRRPFQSNTPEQEYERIRDPDQNAPLLTSFKPGISPALESICAKCISKKPTNRFQSAGEFAAELSRYLASALQAGLTAENAALSGTQAAEPNLSSERPSNIVDNHRNTLNRPANPLKRSWFAVACIFLILLTVFASVLLTPSDNAEILARLEHANAKVTMIYHDHTNRETTLGNGVTEKFTNLMMSPLDPRVEFE
ncbi:MAG: serine/threonine-protein kinase, partial [Planctomycetota bacterium]